MRPEWSECPPPRFFIVLGLILGNLLLAVSGGLWSSHPTVQDLQPPLPQRAQDLIGTVAAEVRALLGPPALIRQEPPAEVWQYRTDACVLDLYVYPAPPPATVRHAEARARHANAPTAPTAAAPEEMEQACLKTLHHKPRAPAETGE